MLRLGQQNLKLGNLTYADVSGTGVLAGCVSVPSRYVHSAVGCVNLDDLEGAVRVILAFIEGLREPIS